MHVANSQRYLGFDYYSPPPKKPRYCKPFEFKPYTLEAYRGQPKHWKSLGKLGNPNMGTD
jgi:hypothetical protein